MNEREALATVLTLLRVEVPTAGPAAGLVEAYSMADAIIKGLAERGIHLCDCVRASQGGGYSASLPKRPTGD